MKGIIKKIVSNILCSVILIYSFLVFVPLKGIAVHAIDASSYSLTKDYYGYTNKTSSSEVVRILDKAGSSYWVSARLKGKLTYITGSRVERRTKDLIGKTQILYDKVSNQSTIKVYVTPIAGKNYDTSISYKYNSGKILKFNIKGYFYLNNSIIREVNAPNANLNGTCTEEYDFREFVGNNLRTSITDSAVLGVKQVGDRYRGIYKKVGTSIIRAYYPNGAIVKYSVKVVKGQNKTINKTLKVGGEYFEDLMTSDLTVYYASKSNSCIDYQDEMVRGCPERKLFIVKGLKKGTTTLKVWFTNGMHRTYKFTVV